ncbi:helicase-related protein [Pontibacter pamirensis]|uniref:helicase-related protein n=1 Tax=Pontibacter pamirensis TaxID=2562824 RepID=UPI00138995DF|nr:helicase-related protein [Pontibacter pamirensis]
MSKYAEILQLKTNESIADEIAFRQLNVIEKAYDYLSQENNNIIYIADEVGLGKTYIALGIASLFRHFTKDPEKHRDLIIVPKKNLQQKWQKEAKNFFNSNYLPENSFLKHYLTEAELVKDRLCCISSHDAISIFRMTSFSSLSSTRKYEFFRYLCNGLFNGDAFCAKVLSDAKSFGFFNKKEHESDLRKLIAYLLNIKSEKINCLIIDEAHNYKHGLGTEEHDNAIRNEVTARFLGAVKDEKLLNQFPSLKTKIKFPLAEKVVCLSATPKDRSLLEIKNQFSCFTCQHVLGNAYTPKDVEQKLKSFLIRGNMEYSISDATISRNQCRYEHRQGNVNKSEVAEPLSIEDDFNSVFWQLLQYKSIKHLNQKHNASFEIGMLAGFESYRLDLDKSIKPERLDENGEDIIVGKEYEYTSKRSEKISQDFNIIKQLLESYNTTFKDIPPHPKQSKLEDEVIRQLKRQEKSLIFVRRVATAHELEKRLTLRFEKEVVLDCYLKLDGRFSKYNTSEVRKLKDRYSERYISEKLPDFFSVLQKNKKIKHLLLTKKTTEQQSLEWLNFTFDNLDFDSSLKKTIIWFIDKGSSAIPKKLVHLFVNALEGSYTNWQKGYEASAVEGEDDEEFNDEAETAGNFFNSYFRKGRSGFNFRQKLYRENWFELNLLLLINYYKLIAYDPNELSIVLQGVHVKEESKKSQTFERFQEAYKNFIITNGILAPSPIQVDKRGLEELSKDTFLTSLLLQECKVEFNDWMRKRVKQHDVSSLINDLEVLGSILKSIFRNGSGLLPAFVADAAGGDFHKALRELITEEDAPFHFVLKEIKTVLQDYDLLIGTSFQERDDKKVSSTLRGLTPVLGISGQAKRDRSIVATQFRTPGYPYVLVTTDIFKEGEDLHTYCQNVYHYGIAWNPSDMEQRTGRIDRINSLSYRKLNEQKKVNFENKIHVFYPYLSQSVEVNQVIKLLENINKFIRTFNDIEADVYHESNVKIDDIFTSLDIPEAITERLTSKYDVGSF